MIIKFTLLLLFTIQISYQEPSPHEVSDHANMDYMADPHPHPPPPPIEVHVHLDTNGKSKSKEIEKGSLTMMETKSKGTEKKSKEIEKGSLTVMKKNGEGFVEVTGSNSGIRLRG